MAMGNPFANGLALRFFLKAQQSTTRNKALQLMKQKIYIQALFAATAAILSSGSAAGASIVFLGGNLATPGNWTGGSLPGAADIGIIDVGGSLSVGNNAGTLAGNESTWIIGGGATITTSGGDWVHANLAQSIVNNATINASDDIFANGSIMTFNAGSTTIVTDDFEANATGILNINGGTHTVGDSFGAQRGAVLNLLGGTVGATGLRTTAGNAGTPAGGTINVGGDGTLTATTLSLDASGFIEFSSAWLGSLTATNLSGTDWQTALDGTTATLDGVAIDATVFANNFQITNGGQTLSMGVIPEPSPLTLLGLGGLGMLALRRRK